MSTTSEEIEASSGDSKFEKPAKSVESQAGSEADRKPRFFEFTEPDWARFRTIDGLCQKAGVAREDLPRLVLKELVDNAADVGTPTYEITQSGFVVADDGPGIDGEPEDIARLFSIARPLTSSKRLRRPTRGALGNGLRVVTGAVLASQGNLRVSTRGRVLGLTPKDDGTTAVEVIGSFTEQGTRIEVEFGGVLGRLPVETDWARRAITLTGYGRISATKISSFWYTDEAFFELLQSAGDRTVRDIVEEFEGCSGRIATQIAAAYPRRTCISMSRDEASTLLGEIRKNSKPVKAARLGHIGKHPELPAAYTKCEGAFTIESSTGTNHATIPFVVEAWARKSLRPEVLIHVNRTPVVSSINVQREQKPHKKDLAVFGCQLRHRYTSPQDTEIWLNVTTPYIPITSDGKAPDLSPLVDEVLYVLGGSARRTKMHGGAQYKAPTKKSVILGLVDAGIEKASGGGMYRYSLRQLFYAVRPGYLAVFKEEPNYDYFCAVITEIENEREQDLPGIYRDARGTLYHPHTGEQIPLGTVAVEGYQRPKWTFNKILYSEKEGLITILVAAGWPEKHDCALMTSKGYASRAARDLIDFLATTTEPITVFCIHDADGPGTRIYEALQEATRARGARNIQIINLGLELDEALEMGLETEPVTSTSRIAVASYVDELTAERLQTQRVELNAMTTPQFIEWLDRKMAPYEGKVVPPRIVIVSESLEQATKRIREVIRERILTAADFDGQTAAAEAEVLFLLEEDAVGTEQHVHDHLESKGRDWWRTPVKDVATRIADEHLNPRAEEQS